MFHQLLILRMLLLRLLFMWEIFTILYIKNKDDVIIRSGIENSFSRNEMLRLKDFHRIQTFISNPTKSIDLSFPQPSNNKPWIELLSLSISFSCWTSLILWLIIYTYDNRLCLSFQSSYNPWIQLLTSISSYLHSVPNIWLLFLIFTFTIYEFLKYLVDWITDVYS